MPGDTQFEAKFAQMANTTLAERIPSLVEHSVGFQIIDKNDEDTKAAGVAAYIINNLYCYIPIFFINGELKGTELLYIHQRDVFVPANDSYISMLKQEGVKALGEPAESYNSRNRSDRFFAPEDVSTAEYDSQFSYKRASINHLDTTNSLVPVEVLEAMHRRLPGGFTQHIKEASIDLSEEIPQLGKRAAHAFAQTVLKDNEFANACLNIHSVKEMENILKTAAETKDTIYFKEGPDKLDDVLFVTTNTEGDMPALDSAEKKLLLEHGCYIKDERTNFSKVYQEQVDTSICSNPTSPGLYDVMMLDGEYKPYVILYPNDLQGESNPARVIGHHLDKGTDRNIALIDPSKPSEYHCCRSADVFVKPLTQVTDANFKILQKAPKADKRSMNRIRKGDHWGKIILVQKPQKSFETRFSHEDTTDGSLILKGGGYAYPTADRNFFNDNPVPKLCSLFAGEEATLDVHDSKLIIPEGTRILTQNTKENLILGCPSVIGMRFAKYAEDKQLMRLSVYSSGNLAQIEWDGNDTGLIDKIAALKHLVYDHKIEGGQAVQLVKEASKADHSKKYFLIKHAYDTSIYEDSVVQPFNEGPRGRREDAITVSLSRSKGEPLSGPMDSSNVPILPQDVIGKATNAANSGIVEVFDTEVLKGLIDVADLSQLKKGYLSRMVKGMDSTGRMLYLYYWHKEAFEENYGRNETAKLENTLRNVFETTGDLILFLREKSTYNDNFSDNLFGSLSEDIGSAAAI